MTCTRCQGLMIEDHLFDFEGAYGHMWAAGFRCMNCGHVHDPVIAQNGRSQQPKVKVLVGVNGEPDCQADDLHLVAEPFLRRAA